MSQTSEAPYSHVSLLFLDSLATTLEGVIAKPRRIVVWRDGPTLNSLELLRWTWPDARHPTAPRSIRISINISGRNPPKTLIRRLGFDPERPPGYRQCLRLEWSLLEHELPEFAAWIPRWIRGRLDPGVEIPVPPLPSHVWGDLLTTHYAWTAAAWDAMDSLEAATKSSRRVDRVLGYATRPAWINDKAPATDE